MWIFWAFQMTPEQVRIQFVFIKLAHIDEGYFCLNNSSGYLTCDILSFFTLFLYLNQPKNDGYKVQVEQAFLHFLGARGHPLGAYSARVFHLCPFASLGLHLPPFASLGLHLPP